MGNETAPPRRIRLRFQGTCRWCGAIVSKGEEALHHREAKAIECLACATPQPPTSTAPPTPVPAPASYVDGVAGASARAEYERRMDRREARVRERFPRAGGALLAVFEEGQSTKAWATGATGEAALGKRFDALAGPGLRVLHDRRIPGSKANIDHIVVTANGVWVIDAKRYKGAPERRTSGGLFRPTVHQLYIGGRDRTILVDGVLRQVELVESALGEDACPVRGALVFQGAEWPMLSSGFDIRGVVVAPPRAMPKRLTAPGELTTERIDALQTLLMEAFPRSG